MPPRIPYGVTRTQDVYVMRFDRERHIREWDVIDWDPLGDLRGSILRLPLRCEGCLNKFLKVT